METKILTASDTDIAFAGEIIKNGGLVAFPTETVYGLGANALSSDAVKSIYKAKGRPSDNPLIVHIAEKEDIIPLVKEVLPKAQALIDAFFPAPLTIILKKSEIIPDATSGGLDTVAIRMPENEIARRIIKASGVPVAAPSANTSGLPSPTRAKHVLDDMNGKIDAIVDGGDCKFGVESTVITLVTDVPTILRPGAVTKEMLEEVIGEVALSSAVLEGMKDGEIAASPGMKYKHYSPRAKIVIVDADKEQYETFVNTRKNAFALCFDGDEISIPHLSYGSENDDLSQARELFDRLRQLDEMGARKVYARIPAKSGVGMAVYNRLIRAAAFNIIDLKKPYTLGLTGQTGAGKGFVCEYLKELGFKIIDADYYSKKLTKKNSPIFPALQAEFGEDIVKDGVLNRKLLARRAFISRERTDKLNSIMHPEIKKLCRAQAKGLCVLDAPQLLEADMQDECYKLVSVTAPESLRLKRIKERDNITDIEAKERISAQHPEEYYLSQSDFTVINDGKSDIKEQINRILEEIL